MKYLLIPKSRLQLVMARLNSIVSGQPGTSSYSEAILPLDPSYDFVCVPIDDRAQTVLTPEEWASRLATMPAEFIRPIPTP